MYMETTNIGETAFADLYSPMLEGNMSAMLGGEKRCFAFWYHMHGAGIGKQSKAKPQSCPSRFRVELSRVCSLVQLFPPLQVSFVSLLNGSVCANFVNSK